jgi:hypothetical protein
MDSDTQDTSTASSLGESVMYERREGKEKREGLSKEFDLRASCPPIKPLT